MTAVWPARYRDRNGEVETTLHSNGSSLRMTLRGVEFAGTMFDDFSPAGGVAPGFPLNQGCLCSCEYSARIPVTVVKSGIERVATLELSLGLGDPEPNGALDRADYGLVLDLAGHRFLAKSSGDVERGLLTLSRQLGPGSFLKCCFTCGLSDYSPLGMGSFGCLACFRGNKAAYRAVRTKEDILGLWESRSGSVQETHLCPDWEPRPPAHGYRG